MKIAALLTVSASLALGACAMMSAPNFNTPPLEADVGPPTQARWDAGNAA